MHYVYYIQTDYALAFVDYAMQFADSDDKALLMGKRTIERQLRRLKKADASTGNEFESLFIYFFLFYNRLYQLYV